jgi:hypothetical protein
MSLLADDGARISLRRLCNVHAVWHVNRGRVRQHPSEAIHSPSVSHSDGRSRCPRDSTLDVDDVPSGVDLVDEERVCDDGLVTHPTRHSFAPPDPARVLATAGRPHLAVHLRGTVCGISALHVVPLHNSCKALANPAQAPSIRYTSQLRERRQTTYRARDARQLVLTIITKRAPTEGARDEREREGARRGRGRGKKTGALTSSQ